MISKPSPENLPRRQFLSTLLPAGFLACLGCSSLFAQAAGKGEAGKPAAEHKFKNPSNLTFEQVYYLAFRMNLPVMQELLNTIGKEKFLSMLQEASSNAIAKSMTPFLKRFPKRDLATFANLMINNPNFKNTLTFTVVKNTPEVFEINVTECLWATTAKKIRVPDAAEIGYASICFADYAMASTFNPKIKMVRDKTLMQGHKCCNHCYHFQKG